MSGYNAGQVPVPHCKDAAAIYRASRRAPGQGLSRADRGRWTPTAISPRLVPAEGLAARTQRAGITFRVRPHDLRHAHASWLLAGGADLQMVKDRLGHGSISTTEKYLHTLPEADDLRTGRVQPDPQPRAGESA